MRWIHVVVATLAVVGLGCPKSPAEGQVKLKLEGLPGLEVHAPAGTQVRKNAVGIGVMLTGPGVSMTIGPALDVDATDLEQAKKNAETYSPKNIAGETLPDGYILTYENEGSTGANFWLVGRRKFADTPYSCGVSSPKKEHQQSAIPICKSMTK